MSPSQSPRRTGTPITAPPDLGGGPLIRLFPEPVQRLAVEEVYADLDLPSGDARRPYTVVNAVGTLDGRGAIGGKSTPIGSKVDHRLMRNIRACVDAVLIGTGTLRSEDLTLTVDENLAERRRARGLKDQPLSVILTGSGHLPTGRRIFQAGKGSVLVLAGAGACQKKLAELSEFATVRTMPENGVPESERVLETLAGEFGVSLLLIEGGPKVNHSFIQRRLVHEIFLTLAPKIAGGNARSLTEGTTLLPETAASSPNLVSVYLAGSELYLRYALRPA